MTQPSANVVDNHGAKDETPKDAWPGKGMIPSLNGIRAVSVIMVVASHFATDVSTPAPVAYFLQLFDGYLVDGGLGVRLFFCISGFLITYLLLVEKARSGSISLKEFYTRRTVRLFPVFYAFILFLFIASQTTALSVTACQYVTALNFTKNYGCFSWIDGHLWSLALEQQFYLIWPGIIAFASRRTAIGVACAAIALAPISRMVELHLGLRQWWLSSNTDSLMIGALLAFALAHRTELFRQAVHYRVGLLRVIAVLILIATVVVRRVYNVPILVIGVGPSLQAFAGAFLIVSYAYGPRDLIFGFLNTRVMNFIGLISYSLYIWQQPFFIWPSDYGFSSLFLLEWPYKVVAMVCVATASYLCLEKPLLKLRHGLSARRNG